MPRGAMGTVRYAEMLFCLNNATFWHLNARLCRRSRKRGRADELEEALLVFLAEA